MYEQEVDKAADFLREPCSRNGCTEPTAMHVRIATTVCDDETESEGDKIRGMNFCKGHIALAAAALASLAEAVGDQLPVEKRG